MMIHHFFDFAFFVFCMSEDIFVLSDQNGDLAGHMSFQRKKIKYLQSCIVMSVQHNKNLMRSAC